MEHVAVNSNLLASVAHDGTTTMQVLFKRGGLYQHEDVTLEEFSQIINPGAEFENSVGKAYASLIKGRKPTFKVEAGNHAAPINPPPVVEPAPTSNTPADIPVEAQAVSRKSTELTTQAHAIEVNGPIAQREASEMLLSIAAMQTEIQNTFKPMKDAAYKAHRIICDQEKTLLSPLVEAERALKGRIGAYELEQRRIAAAIDEQNRQAERARADEEARQRAAEQAIVQAVELEERGDIAAAEAVLANPAPVPVRYVAPAPIAPAVSKTKGVRTVFEWAGRITNADQIPREYLIVDEALINAVVKRSMGKIRIPGVENYEKPVVASSRRG